MSHGLGCAVEAALVVQGERQKENKERDERRTRPGDGTSGSGRGSNREVVSKEISVRIIVACGHDITPFLT